MHVLLRGSIDQRLRLASGLALMLFAATHFLNHAVGLVGLDAMLAVQQWRTAVTRFAPVSVLLLAALLTHAGLGLLKLARRTTWHMPPWEAAQIATGLMVPWLLIQHVVDNRGAAVLAGTRDTYRYELANLWPGFAWDQSALLLIVWVHGCIGLHFWLRLTPLWRRVQPFALAVAVAVPILALAGFSVAGREVAQAVAAPGAWERLMREANAPAANEAATLQALKAWLQTGFLVLAALAVLAPLLRALATRLAATLSVAYVAGPTVRSIAGPTLLEISRSRRVPHVSTCGGRARCSTCRVRVVDGAAKLPLPGPAEAATLRSVGAGRDVRLACQLRPGMDITVERMVSPRGALALPASASAEDTGTERTLAILFFDLRGFTRLSENKLPYDVVFLLNQLFTAASEAIRARGGRIDKYMGDGLMAVFGVDVEADEACRRAVLAARDLDLALERLGKELAGETGAPLACAMGLHVGPMVLGRIGCPVTAQQTVIGSTVNAASRLESLAKETNCQLAVSRQVLRRAGVSLSGLQSRRVEIRGLAAPLTVVTAARARDLRP